MKIRVLARILSVPVAVLIGWTILKRKRRPVSENKDALKMLYFETGLQYYISARYSASAGLIPISGNLFHHAFEMFIKGYLTQDLDESERLRFRHGLKKLWKLYKKKIGDPALDRFDNRIASLDKFESIRYPEPIARSGMTATIDFGGPIIPAVSTSGSGQLRAFRIDVVELDELMKLIFTKSHVSLAAFTNRLSRDALEYLNR
jgi:hypothetical protein